MIPYTNKLLLLSTKVCLIVMIALLTSCTLFNESLDRQDFDTPYDKENSQSVDNQESTGTENSDLEEVEESREGHVISENPYIANKIVIAEDARQLFSRAAGALSAGNHAGAETLLLELIALYPQLSGPYLNLGLIEKNRERYSEAESLFKKAIEVNGFNVEAYNQLAILYREQGKFELSGKSYQQAISVWPDYAEAHLNLGILYDLYMGKLDLALEHYQRYQSLQEEPERRVVGWIKDLQRRIKRREAAK